MNLKVQAQESSQDNSGSLSSSKTEKNLTVKSEEASRKGYSEQSDDQEVTNKNISNSNV